MRFIDWWLKHLFGTDAKPTTGDQLFFKIIELYIVYHTISLAWSAAFYTLKIDHPVQSIGIANYLDTTFMYGTYWPVILASVLTMVCMLAFLRKGPKWLYLFAFSLLHVIFVSRYSLGKMPHGYNFIGMSLLALSLGLIVGKEIRQRLSLTLGIIYFFVGLGYTTAAISKLIATGIHWADGHHLWLWMAEKHVDVWSRQGYAKYNFLQQLIVDHIHIATAILTFGLLTELMGFLLWFQKTRIVMIGLLIGMHIGIYFTMNIWFGTFMSELLLIGLPWGVWLNHLNLSFFQSWKLLNE